MVSNRVIKLSRCRSGNRFGPKIQSQCFDTVIMGGFINLCGCHVAITSGFDERVWAPSKRYLHDNRLTALKKIYGILLVYVWDLESKTFLKLAVKPEPENACTCRTCSVATNIFSRSSFVVDCISSWFYKCQFDEHEKTLVCGRNFENWPKQSTILAKSIDVSFIKIGVQNIFTSRSKHLYLL